MIRRGRALDYRCKKHLNRHKQAITSWRHQRPTMITEIEDVVLVEVKRAYQEQGRQAVRDGLRTPQSLHFINPDMARKSKIDYESIKFD